MDKKSMQLPITLGAYEGDFSKWLHINTDQLRAAKPGDIFDPRKQLAGIVPISNYETLEIVAVANDKVTAIYRKSGLYATSNVRKYEVGEWEVEFVV